ncbi:APC family permease [Gilvimarinus sp. SDUM040013]|uniref:APC family permease n=1 Tax=Gilvimarinus gilvus TaxID=3058038 RepID=A0ABU4S0T2_9GAMM|nr:APC family permease [Gilvimarinus sp. SDUM040013]MDO3384582.1 APC family permease [Gilvimarinus sp. SDUM040013]MDX6850082.1 APC family permease [Gilvimarinus sp. SDUM040013]
MPNSSLARKLTYSDAVFIGLAAMVGAGIFTAISPAAAAAGPWIGLSLLIAAFIAFCNAASSAELAALYPSAGGTYLYAGKQLHPFAGFIAGACFLCGKTASGAAMALAFAHYAFPAWEKPLAVSAILVLTLVNLVGIEKTAQASRIIVCIVIAGLLILVGLCLSTASPIETAAQSHLDLSNILQGAAIWFFAFAGYARLATLSEEVKEPGRVLNKAIITSLLLALALYGLVAFAALRSAGADALAASPAPLATAVQAAGYDQLRYVVACFAALACLGVLLSLIAGISRTLLAMSRAGDMPRSLSVINAKFQTPARCELAVACAMIAAVLLFDLAQAIGFSAFSVLLYYALANISALTLSKDRKIWPRIFSVIGLLGCVALAFSLPVITIAISMGLLVLFALYYIFTVLWRRHVPDL